MALDYTSHLRADGERMVRAVSVDLDAHVPTCPAWNVAKLTIHTGQHHRWVADAIRRRGDAPENPPKPGLRGDELVEWFRAGWRELADLLDRTSDDEPAWSWSGDDRAGFWRRRTALETLVHRWDAENAVGTTSPLDPALAADGVDEFLFVMVALNGGVYRGPRLHVDLATSDAPGRWSLALEDGAPPRPSLGEPKASGAGAVSVEGRAEDVLLFLWGRRGPESVALSGDDGSPEALLRWMRE
ncbi:MAG TPA: maleylpyruvate isomerase family mycothiol-dependent enzyme [Actinomycetota bacterium]|nr:maleylpyruvate isomerase family mycothiol-dependent enzyme [Actinomycetota bacterium]